MRMLPSFFGFAWPRNMVAVRFSLALSYWLERGGSTAYGGINPKRVGHVLCSIGSVVSKSSGRLGSDDDLAIQRDHTGSLPVKARDDLPDQAAILQSEDL